MVGPEEQPTEKSESTSECSYARSGVDTLTPNENETVEQVTEMRIRISRDGMTAFLDLSAKPEEPYPFTVETIMQALRERGVIEGILNEEIQEIVAQRRYVSDFPVARGQDPEGGEDARIEFLFDPSPKPYSQDTLGSVDWREINLIQKVVENQPVARKIPAREGKPGKTVTGRTAEPRKVRDARIPMGRGTKIDENDPNLLLADIPGSVRLAFNQVVVDKVLSVPRDVDFSIGNIDIDGGVQIGGNVLPGFRVRATGDIHVEGYVESATIESGASVWVSKGILGQENKTVLRAEKDIHAKFATNAVIRAGGDISIHSEAVNCRLDSGGTISIGSHEGTRGRIAGGEVSAAIAIQAIHIGAESGTATVLNVTAKTASACYREMRELTEQITNSRDQHEKVMAKVATILQQRLSGELKWDESNVQMFSRLSATAKQMEEQVQGLEEQLAECKRKLESIGEPRVIVRGTLFPGVRITMGHATRSFNEKLERVRIVLTDDHSRIVTLGY